MEKPPSHTPPEAPEPDGASDLSGTVEPAARFLGLSHTAWMVLVLVAVTVVTFTAVGIFYASRSVQVVVPGEVIVPDAAARTQPEQPQPFASEIEGRRFFVKMLEAARRAKKEDLEFLVSLYGDRREVPIPPRPDKDDGAKNTQAPEEEAYKKALHGLKVSDARKPEPGFDTVQNVAVGFLSGMGPLAAPPTLSRLKDLHAEHTAGKSWTFDEIQVMRSGLTVLSQLQGRLIFMLKRNQVKSIELPSSAILLFASSKSSRRYAHANQELNAEDQVREVPLGLIWLDDKKVTMNSINVPGDRYPRYDVTPERFPELLEAVETQLWPMVQYVTQALKRANANSGTKEKEPVMNEGEK